MKGNTERLIHVISHLMSPPDSGQHISDVYDFQKQAWFTYHDLVVSEIQESVMQEARPHTGYIFFHMHNEIFQSLLRKARNSHLEWRSGDPSGGIRKR